MTFSHSISLVWDRDGGRSMVFWCNQPNSLLFNTKHYYSWDKQQRDYLSFVRNEHAQKSATSVL